MASVFSKLKFSSSNGKSRTTEVKMPVNLLPLSAPVEEVTEIISDYDINILGSIPPEIRDSFAKTKIELNIANPHVFITYDINKDIYKYVLIEPPIDNQSFEIYKYLISEIERELLNSKTDQLDLGKVIYDASMKRKDLEIIQGSKGELQVLSTRGKISLYYLLRNMFGYNILTPLLADYKIEDISCSGLDLPIFVYHKEYEYLPTNIVIKENMKVLDIEVDGAELLDQIVMRYMTLANKTISIATPINDGILPKGDRIAATFRREVSARGSSFVIRRFNDRPITILDLTNSGVLSPEVAAYLWYAIDLRMSFMVLGVTGAGKTTMLNAILNLAKESMKIVSIEDIPEIRLAQDNWVQLHTREVYGGAGKEITLMDLLKLSLRYRPDIIVVGEIRGQEAYVLFQALSTGHGGATTFHAYDTDSAIKRLMNEPLNIPKEWIPMMNIMINVRRLPVYVGEKIVLRRRAVAIDEIVSYNDFRRVSSWEPKSDTHTLMLENAKVLLTRIGEMGKSLDEVKNEIERRATYLKLLSMSKEVVQSLESYKEVKKYIIKYSLRPEEALKEAYRMSSIKITAPP
ncbi:MAG: type II secretion system protein E [Candidatus Aramenus sulfurataquae]|jgi:flagellar protein FlaI|uniref:Type II secretion system protein E n=2 Tax=Candidatus Aramenus sulfurataquae TaxID=1326980 RepID=W7KMT9_9CREN|nr:MAG: type II secretion system protein E [Candidatus Aramenus sulfurataquae]MCL7343789.1 type II/IV secretion system ATPase subunit [Candidatus Aramenus sulfurataquae]